MYTDGVTEATNHQLEMFGEERLMTIIRENSTLPPDAILEKILRGVETFSSGEPQFDDITLMVIKGT
jgi:sigma-B regulation protein RsbU (phosphoserine phosphatase)